MIDERMYSEKRVFFRREKEEYRQMSTDGQSSPSPRHLPTYRQSLRYSLLFIAFITRKRLLIGKVYSFSQRQKP